jgi:hypothetical protein
MLLASGIGLFLGAIVFNAIWDYRIWLKQLNLPKNKRNHNKGWWLKFLTSVPAAVCFALASNFIWVLALASTAFLLIAWFVFGFDMLYNTLRGYEPFYRGTEDGKDDAKTDNIWQSMPQWLHVTIKGILLILSTAAYYAGLD